MEPNASPASELYARELRWARTVGTLPLAYRVASLTAMEARLAVLLCDGLAVNRALALIWSTTTSGHHAAVVYDKLGARNMRDLRRLGAPGSVLIRLLRARIGCAELLGIF